MGTSKLETTLIPLNGEWSAGVKRILSESRFRELLDTSDDLDSVLVASTPTPGGETLTRVLTRKSMVWAKHSLERLPIRLTLENVGVMAIVMAVFMPRVLTYTLIYPMFRLVFGTLYPAYASYKAVRTKNVKEYVKWMMYWIVFALFTCAETFTDVFFSFWFPFYYEIKIILVLWLLSPATKGSSILYRRFVHPALSRREAEIDEALARATEQGYTAVLQLGSKGVNYATTVLMQTAIKGGGGLVQQLRKSYSLSDLTGEKEDVNRNSDRSPDETDYVGVFNSEPRLRDRAGRRGYSPRRTQSIANHVDMYFSEVDLEVRKSRSREPVGSLTNIKSNDDISSGYGSGEALQQSQKIQVSSHEQYPLVRTASVGTRSNRSKTRTATKKAPEVEELPEEDEEAQSHPLSHLTPDQTLEILRFLSQNKDYVRMLQQSHSDTDDEDDDSTLKSDSPDTKNVKKLPEEFTDAKIVLDETKIKAEMCSEKLVALKELIQSANNTVASIVTTQENPNLLDVKASISRSSSDSSERAGRYHKKPAPKVPDEAEEEKPLKATLVIKTGLTNNEAVDAVIKKRKKVQEKKMAAREGFSKFLAIPKNILHNAFHRDDDARSLSSRSRSTSRENVDALLNSEEDITYISLKPDRIDSDIATLTENRDETETDV